MRAGLKDQLKCPLPEATDPTTGYFYKTWIERTLNLRRDRFDCGPGKGLPSLIKAFATIAQKMPEALSVLVGDGARPAQLEQQADW